MLRFRACARCRSTWVPGSEQTTGPQYCPLCKLQTTPVIEQCLRPHRQSTGRLFVWFGATTIPILALTMLLHAAFAVTYLAKRTAKSGQDTRNVSAPFAGANSLNSYESRPPQREAADIEITRPSHQPVVVILPPPQQPAEQASRSVEELEPSVEAPEPAVPVAKDDPPKTCQKPSGVFGTSLAFATNPTEARKQAAAKEKLLFLLHVSGDFDDPGFT